MLFNSLHFLFFLFIVVFTYWVLPPRRRPLCILVTSWIFYASWDVRFLGLILLSVLIDFIAGKAIFRLSRPRARSVLAISIVANVGILLWFKYFDFFVAEAHALLIALGYSPGELSLGMILPVGISFYTFQSMSYSIDVYRKKIVPTRRLVDFAAYVSFFPQLIAGPIERASRLLPQISIRKNFSLSYLQTAIWFLSLGFFHKVVVADNLAPFVERVVHAPGDFNGFDLFLAFYAFVLFVYADFSGYSLIARGCANLFGIDLIQNFRLPLFARSPAEFWRRWHVSLGTWFYDYVFWPLGRKLKKVPGGAAIAVLFTFSLIGLWHGASWNFVLFGVYHGVLYLGYYVLRRKWRTIWGSEGLFKRCIDHLLAFHIISAGTVLFLMREPQKWLEYFSRLLSTTWEFEPSTWLWTFLLFGGATLLADLWVAGNSNEEFRLKRSPLVQVVVIVLLFNLVVYLGSIRKYEFVYFQF